MYQTVPYKELEEIFGGKAVDKLYSILQSMDQTIEDLRKSRDNWKNKYMKLKNDIKIS